MEINWVTFLLEIINFLVLVWILKRLLYRPILNAINKRKQQIDDAMNEAEQTKQDALATQARYQQELEAWQAHRQSELNALKQEIHQEREHQMDKLHETMSFERKKLERLEANTLQEMKHELQGQALDYAVAFASRILERLASPPLEAAFVSMFLQDLETVPAQETEKWRQSLEQNGSEVNVFSAHPLEPELQQQLRDGLQTVLQQSVAVNFNQDKALIGGLRVECGGHMLQANIKRELEFFRQYPEQETELQPAS